MLVLSSSAQWRESVRFEHSLLMTTENSRFVRNAVAFSRGPPERRPAAIDGARNVAAIARHDGTVIDGVTLVR